MDSIDKIIEGLGKLPLLLHQYSGYSYPMLALLLTGGALLLGTHLLQKRRGAAGLSPPLAGFGAVLVFFALSGFALRWMGGLSVQHSQQAFISQHRAPPGEHWLLVFDFSLPSGLSDAQKSAHMNHMQGLVSTITEVLLEDMPADFSQPRVVRIATQQSPWAEGINPANYDEVLKALNGFEIMWGDIHPEGQQAKAFLGVSHQLAGELDSMIPLKDFAFDQDPRLEHQFGDGYYRLLGLVALGMALDTYQRAQGASGEQRKTLYLKAAQQFTQARARVNNRRDDPILQRNVFAPRVDMLINTALTEAGVTP